MNKRNRQRGAAVVEFAILIGLLLVFLFGIFEFGFLWLESSYIVGAAREGARTAAKIAGTTSADVDKRQEVAEQAVEEYLRSLFLFADKIDKPDQYPAFLTTTYTRNPERLLTVTADGETIIVPMAEVTVKVNTAMVWEPVLWPLLSALIPGVDHDSSKLRELTQSAAYAIQ